MDSSDIAQQELVSLKQAYGPTLLNVPNISLVLNVDTYVFVRLLISHSQRDYSHDMGDSPLRNLYQPQEVGVSDSKLLFRVKVP